MLALKLLFEFILFAVFMLLLQSCSAIETQPVLPKSNAPELEMHTNLPYFVTRDGYHHPILAIDQPEAPAAIIIALHGFNDYSNAFSGMCRYFVAQDIMCVAYDQRGFGATEYKGIWPSSETLKTDLDVLATLLTETYPGVPLYLAGESMGGAVIISAMAENTLLTHEEIKGVALFAPAVWSRDFQPWYQRWALSLAVRIAPAWTPTGESLGIVATDNIEALRQMSRDPLVIKETRIDTIYGLTNLMDMALAQADSFRLPAIIMYGEKDEVIPKQPTCSMLDKVKQSGAEHTLRIYPNGYHMLTRDLQAETVFEELLQWIQSEGEYPTSMAPSSLCIEDNDASAKTLDS